jgi:amino acid permease
MHYIQNNWFVMNWLWMIILCIVGVALVAYINNRTVLLKKSLVSLTAILVITLSISFTNVKVNPITLETTIMNSISDNNNQVESSGIFSKAFNLMLDVLKDRIAD